MPVVAIVNQALDVDDAELAVWVNAIQDQLVEDVAPFWREAADITLLAIAVGEPPPPATWQVVITENADRANALGYHELTDFSLPLGKVFSETTTDDRQTVSRVLSHEILEMVVDPFIARKQTIDGTTYLVEVGDPVHLDSMGYERSGVLVSNFATPDYYRYTAGTRYDFRGLVHGPCPALLSGGALCVVVGNDLRLIVAPDATAEEAKAVRIHEGSRRYRWERGHRTWRNSEPWRSRRELDRG